MMETQIRFVRRGEVALSDKTGEIIAGLFEFPELFGRHPFRSKVQCGRFEDLTNFAKFVDFVVGHFTDKETAALTLIDKTFAEQASEALTNRRPVNLQPLSPKLFPNAVIGSNLENQNSMTQLVIGQFRLGSFRHKLKMSNLRFRPLLNAEQFEQRSGMYPENCDPKN